MHWILWSLIANAAIIWIEHIYRFQVPSFWQALPMVLPLVFISQWGLFHVFNSPKHWLMAWVVFTLGNTVMRLVVVAHSKDVFNLHIVGGTALVLAGAFMISQGTKM